MSSRTGDAEAAAHPTVGVDAVDLDRYSSLRLEDSEVIIYDRKSENAWVQSTAAIELRLMV